MNRTEIQQLQNTLLAKHAVEKVREQCTEFFDNYDAEDHETMEAYLDDIDEAVALYQEMRKLGKEIIRV